jgi:hypothetical protein
MSDGNLLDNNKNNYYHRITLKLKSTDSKPIKLLHSELNCKNNIKTNSYKDKRTNKIYSSTRVDIHSEKIYLDLEKHGMFPNKSCVEKPPINLDQEYELAFIRGIIDGDGSIGLYTTDKQTISSISISTGKELNNWILNTIKKHTNIKVGYIANHYNTTKLIFSGIKNVKEISKWMLSNHSLNKISLNRKNNIMEKVLKYEDRRKNKTIQ